MNALEVSTETVSGFGNGLSRSASQLSKDNFTCNQYVRENSTFVVYGGYEGVPMNLGVNLLGWMSLIVLFSLLRKSAWNYGRLALVHKNERRWTQLFYGSEEVGGRLMHRNSWLPDSPYTGDVASSDRGGIFSWIVALFAIKDSDILHKCGPDAVQYLSFQRHVIGYLFAATIIAICVVLPVNYNGHAQIPSGSGVNNSVVVRGREAFALTTITNLSPTSHWLWLHAILAVLLLPLAVSVMRHFSSRLTRAAPQTSTSPSTSPCQVEVVGERGESGAGTGGRPQIPVPPVADTAVLEEPGSCVARALMVTNIPRIACNRNTVARHFQEAYPSLELIDVQFCYNISRLMSLDQQRDAAFQARLYSDEYLASTGRRLSIRPYICGNACYCCSAVCNCPEVDAIEHYYGLETRFTRQVEIEKVAALNQPLGIAFLVFKTPEMARRVLREHDRVLRCGQSPPTSSVSSLLKPYRWHVRFASPPEDIYWQNLNHSSFWWYFRSVIVNLLLFLVLFFLTTPIIVANAVEKLWITDQVKSTSPLVSEFLPTLLLWTLAALMPVLVAYTDRFIFHWTRSSENYSIMMKTFTFLLFMVLILPSLGLSSARALVEWMAHTSEETRWNCVFMPDNGAFFVNYVITSAFIGTALELIRFPELFMYAFRMCLARSQADIASVRTAILFEFPFGVQYGWMLLIFAITVVYSLLSPLIAPFGFIYMCLKHFVDKHNIFYAYGPSRIKRRIHATAINFVILSVCLSQLCLCLFTYSHQGMSGLTVFSLTGLSVTLAIFLGHVFFHWFNYWVPVPCDNNDDSSGSTVTCQDNSDLTNSDNSCVNSVSDNVLPLNDTVIVRNRSERQGVAVVESDGSTTIIDRTFIPSVLLRAPQVRVRDTGDVYTYPTANGGSGGTSADSLQRQQQTNANNATGASSGRSANYTTHRTYGTNNEHSSTSATGASSPESDLYQNYNNQQQDGADQVRFG